MEEFGYNLTADLIRKSRTYGMADVHYMIYADLRACGWTMRNAWMVAFNGQGTNWTKDMLEKEGLPVSFSEEKPDPEMVIASAMHDKKAEGESIVTVRLDDIGSFRFEAASREQLMEDYLEVFG